MCLMLAYLIDRTIMLLCYLYVPNVNLSYTYVIHNTVYVGVEVHWNCVYPLTTYIVNMLETQWYIYLRSNE